MKSYEEEIRKRKRRAALRPRVARAALLSNSPSVCQRLSERAHTAPLSATHDHEHARAHSHAQGLGGARGTRTDPDRPGPTRTTGLNLDRPEREDETQNGTHYGTQNGTPHGGAPRGGDMDPRSPGPVLVLVLVHFLLLGFTEGQFFPGTQLGPSTCGGSGVRNLDRHGGLWVSLESGI
ncbi:hypothetical protein EYF80_060422 [Liparis tanakae]|uniref:Uncharacterized protein n=1 Tax=Liparis tanakae TaxID=230148 RepID=A0A4Z2EKU1_9TELE|nr:hypothetical protein EYF80_060422 [Liparis tanakae]